MLLRLFPQDYNFLRPAYWFGQVDSRPLSLFRIFLPPCSSRMRSIIFRWRVGFTAMLGCCRARFC